MKKWAVSMMGLLGAVIAALATPSFLAEAAQTAPTEKQELVFVIDPGHGGSNVGGQIPGLDEKNATLITALAMKEELEKYEGVTVYLTRYDDSELSLSQRPALAASVGADFLFSLHYNKAVPNRIYGAEVWIPSLGELYSKGYACGDMILNELCDGYGLYRRGIKTKLSSQGKDYYGVIKNASALGLPSMIIEHCHIDNETDVPYFNSIEKLQKMGQLDATGVAKYFQLRSSVLGVDYSGMAHTVISPAPFPVSQDLTPPEQAQILSVKKSGGQLQATLQGVDTQSGILYYDYSLDGGATWSSLQPWSGAAAKIAVTIPKTGSTLTIRVYNQYDLMTQSSTVSVS